MNKKEKEILKMSEEELKESFVSYFGQEKWEEEVALGKIFEYELLLANYLGVDAIPVIVEDMMEDSRLYIQEKYIALSRSCVRDYLESLKAVSHEYRHYYQIKCVEKGMDNNLVNNWKDDFLYPVEVNDPDDVLQMTLYAFMSIEIDAFAFQKFALKKFLGLETRHPSEEYDAILEDYISKYFSN